VGDHSASAESSSVEHVADLVVGRDRERQVSGLDPLEPCFLGDVSSLLDDLSHQILKRGGNLDSRLVADAVSGLGLPEQ
jgi:hypothetical protein